MATIRQCLQAVSEATGISVSDLRGPSKLRRIAWPRQAVMWMARQGGHSTPKIARLLGGRSPSTINIGSCSAASRYDSDEEYGDMMQDAWGQLDRIGAPWPRQPPHSATTPLGHDGA